MHKRRAAQSLKDMDKLLKSGNVCAQQAASYMKSIPAPCGGKRCRDAVTENSIILASRLHILTVLEESETFDLSSLNYTVDE